jgi:hypothetical protein
MKQKQTKSVIKNANSKLEGKAFGCSEVFTLDKKGRIIKREWKREEIKSWKW